ncbi:creatininase family protein [Subtercola frigoramans]|uniref:Creatinine amidohydrolase/Fe(II)-dependent formamide hydrolase-like protein n=1 Tax=Subtercola frigoramans TaxID=120298 RepID=A0ABS2L2J4_9MICO|nr:creatininase family protein [Subtercola frigoramans]MBM7471126.1 creatinine amidohydrolase/Fe(II)-dependent formamide hydrolase-like protein [Subtercola frigoramans]
MHQLAHLSTTDIAAIDASNAVIVQPIGAMEQHGAHLPVITDALTAEHITDRAIRSLPAGSNIWQLPTIHYGKSTEHLGRAGTIAMSAATLMGVCMDLGASLAASGFRKLVFVNGHGGQPSLLDLVARDIRVQSGLEVFPLMPGRFALPDGVEQIDTHYGIHGGQIETSIMLALAPELVTMSRARKDGEAVGRLYENTAHLSLEGPVPTAWVIDDVSKSGVLGDPTAADARTGHLIVQEQTRVLAEALIEIRDFRFPQI